MAAGRVDDATALRLEKVRNTLQTAHVMAQVQTHRHVAILAVALTVAGGAALGGIGGQVSVLTSAFGVLGSAILLLSQVRALGIVSSKLQRASDEANEAIDRLMVSGGETDVDEPQTDR